MRKVKYFKPTYIINRIQSLWFILDLKINVLTSFLLKYGKISQQEAIYFLFQEQNAGNKYQGGL